jgi:DNA-binding CsgD family transcriptional regulator/tetratricopeptide (TPR) repeat protein
VVATGGDNPLVAKRVSSPELIGREEEVATLAEAVQRAAGGEFGTILVAGEAGVGKTRLIAEMQRRAADEGTRILAGECVELAEGELPFAPLTTALRPVAHDLGPAELDRLPGREELARLWPELGDPGKGWIRADSALDEPLSQARLFEVLLALLSRVGEQEPVVLVIEDLHWADRSTRDFLSFLVRNARDARLLLVCSYRSDELHRRHPLRPFLAELERRATVERVELAPLSREELGALLEGILGEPPGALLLADLFERSDGNPFFAEELLAASSDGRVIPDTLREALMVRVESLSQPARELLRAAAAAGRRVNHRLLAEASDLSGPELDDALRDAVAHHVLVQDAETYAFRHALVREAVLSDLLPGERSKLHVTLAEALTADPSLGEDTAGAAAAEVAHHWWEARRLPEALKSLVEAGRAAEDVYAFAEAHRHLENALEIWDEVEDAEARAGTDRPEVLSRAAENANMAGELGRAVVLAQRAVDLTDAAKDPVRSALQRERLGRYLWVTGDAEGALQRYQEAVELMPDDPPTPQLARVLAAHGQILMLRGRPRESRERCEQAIEVSRSVGARAEEGHALNTLGVDVSTLGDRAKGIEHLQEAKRIAEELGWIDEIGRVYVNLSEEIDWDGRTAESVELTLEGADVMRRLGARAYVVFLEMEAAHRLYRLGRLAEADRLVSRVGEDGARGLGAGLCGDAEADLALARGDVEAAAHALRRGRQALGQTRDSMYFGPSAATEVELEILRGRPEDAAAAFEGALDAITGAEYTFSMARLYARGTQAYAELAGQARTLGNDAALAEAERKASAAVERFDAILAPEHHELGSPVPVALAYRAVSAGEMSRLAGQPDADTWRMAAERWAALEMPLEEGYAQWRGGEALLLTEGDRGEAGELLSRAAATARKAGHAVLLGEVEALARRARIPLPAEPGRTDGDGAAAPSPADELGLTDRELEVLELVAEGCTNREIGEKLFISEKTASVHVSRILAKLDVRSRVEAATAAQRLGIVTGRGEPADAG